MCGVTVKFGALASVDRICDRNLMQAHFLGDDLEVISVGEILSTQTVVSGWSMYSEISLTGKAVVAFCRALSVWSTWTSRAGGALWRSNAVGICGEQPGRPFSHSDQR